jgi:hypothetical protein
MRSFDYVVVVVIVKSNRSRQAVALPGSGAAERLRRTDGERHDEAQQQ